MKKTNIVFLGGFPYPQGMAGTKRIQHAIDALKSREEVFVKVVVLRQSSTENQPAGLHQGVCYETVAPDLLRSGFISKYPSFHRKAKLAIDRAFKSEAKNILYVYGPPMLDNIAAVQHAKKLGFKVIFDIVEDDEKAANICPTLWHKINNRIARTLTKRIAGLADGLIVISSRLESKFSYLKARGVPLHLRPISVDFERFSIEPERRDNVLRIFYAGSYGIKDGVESLISAFDIVASKYDYLRLVLVGKGDEDRMRSIASLIGRSSSARKVDLKGYMSDDEYYEELVACDIPCMTRINSDYANAGFPFKLGEFLATGKPVIASRISDVESLLEHRVDAMLVEPGNVVDIANALDFIISNPDQASALGRQGRNKARQLFDYRSQGVALHDFIITIGDL